MRGAKELIGFIVGDGVGDGDGVGSVGAGGSGGVSVSVRNNSNIMEHHLFYWLLLRLFHRFVFDLAKTD